MLAPALFDDVHPFLCRTDEPAVERRLSGGDQRVPRPLRSGVFRTPSCLTVLFAGLAATRTVRPSLPATATQDLTAG